MRLDPYIEDLVKEATLDVQSFIKRHEDASPLGRTHACEALQRVPTSDLVIDYLGMSLSHEKSFVREGALYGLYGHIRSERRHTVIKLITSMFSDPVEDISELACELIVGQVDNVL